MLNRQELEAQCKQCADALEEALGEDIDNDLYAETKEAMGSIYILQKWLSCDPGALQLTEISRLIDITEDFVVNQLPEKEDGDA